MFSYGPSPKDIGPLLDFYFEKNRFEVTFGTLPYILTIIS